MASQERQTADEMLAQELWEAVLEAVEEGREPTKDPKVIAAQQKYDNTPIGMKPTKSA